MNKEKRKPDIALLVKCALEAGATVIKNDAGRPAGITVNGKPVDMKEVFENMFPSNNCQDE